MKRTICGLDAKDLDIWDTRCDFFHNKDFLVSGRVNHRYPCMINFRKTRLS